MSDKFLKTKELLNKYNVSGTFLRKSCREGKIESFKKGKLLYINENSFLNYINLNKIKFKKNENEIYDLIKEKLGNDYEIINVGRTVNERCEIKHKRCNTVYIPLISNVIYKNTKCPTCFGKNKKNIEYVKDKVFEITYGEYEVLSNIYKNNKDKLVFFHNIDNCRKEFSMRYNDFVDLNRRCPHCKRSIGEEKICEYLDFNKIEYERNYKILHNGKIQFVDFKINYLGNDIYIEYDGIQHFEKYFKSNEISFKKTIDLDLNKNDYFEKNNLILYRIHYKKLYMINDILDKILNHSKEKNRRTFNDYLGREYIQVNGNRKYSNVIFLE